MSNRRDPCRYCGSMTGCPHVMHADYLAHERAGLWAAAMAVGLVAAFVATFWWLASV